jgi:DnaA family protein
MQQLPLPIRLNTRTTLENYIAGSNLEVVDCLRSLLARSPEMQVFIWSRIGRGKTHLLQALSHAAGQNNLPVAYLSMEQFAEAEPEILTNLDQLKLVCIDDVDKVCDRPNWAEALFHLINRCRAKSCPLVFTAAQSPQSMPVALPDLASRFLWGQVFHLKPLEDSDLTRFLREQSAERGLEMPIEVMRYLMQRSCRDVGELLKQIDMLDESGLARQRRITVPFVREILNL